METKERIERFLNEGPWALVGASQDRSKFGNKVLRAYLAHELELAVVHPREDEIEGVPCARSLAELEPRPASLSIVTPPKLAVHWVREASRLGIHNLWFQPGAESEEALALGEELDLMLLAGGPCILVELDKRT